MTDLPSLTHQAMASSFEFRIGLQGCQRTRRRAGFQKIEVEILICYILLEAGFDLLVRPFCNLEHRCLHVCFERLEPYARAQKTCQHRYAFGNIQR